MNKLFLFSFLLVSVLGARRTATPPTVAHKHLEYRFPSFWGIGYPLEVIPEDEIKKVKEVKEVKVVKKPIEKKTPGWFCTTLNNHVCSHFDPNDPKDKVWKHPDDVMDSIE